MGSAIKLALAVVLVACVSGCGVSVSVSTEQDASYDSALAKQTLIEALDAWKQGKAATLAKRKPPIRFTDDDLRTGGKLVEYQFSRPDEPIRKQTSVSVRIKVVRGKGPPHEHEAQYQVSLSPQLAVMRADP